MDQWAGSFLIDPHTPPVLFLTPSLRILFLMKTAVSLRSITEPTQHRALRTREKRTATTSVDSLTSHLCSPVRQNLGVPAESTVLVMGGIPKLIQMLSWRHFRAARIFLLDLIRHRRVAEETWGEPMNQWRVCYLLWARETSEPRGKPDDCRPRVSEARETYSNEWENRINTFLFQDQWIADLLFWNHSSLVQDPPTIPVKLWEERQGLR